MPSGCRAPKAILVNTYPDSKPLRDLTKKINSANQVF
ncbi:hypothetical protein QE369_004426 [Agrobacterium larrymoorei]|uniref:Uncharacterized protein n=1 Tax=Agrobacterium larrymoorei TaxID=160699 RepID=A0AAJ2ETN9_9HYPH|nr:hypothetical protein [Agrobacterium larrymoorei]